MIETASLAAIDDLGEQRQRPGADAQVAGVIFAIILIDEDGVIAEANPAAENLLGTSAKRLVGRKVFEVIGPFDARIEAHLLIHDAPLVARGLILRTSNQERRVNLTLSPLSSWPGWRVLTLSEASQPDASDEDGDETSRLAAPAVLAHEIKNPLAAIRGAGQLVARKLEPEDRALATMITDEVDRIARLIDRMQRLGSTTPEPVAPCNPHEAIRAAIATVRAANPHRVEIAEEFDPSIPPVLANRDALDQILINLISNACDACAGATEPRVTVQTRFVSGLIFNAIRLGRAVRLPIEISVNDNGPGIPAELQDHIFEPFVSGKKSGQGLGLALVRKLVRDMDGRINHDRDMAKGLTHFRVHLPMAKSGETS